MDVVNTKTLCEMTEILLRRGINIETNKIIKKGITGFTSESNILTEQDIKPFVSLLYATLRGELEWEDLDLVGKRARN